MVRCVKPKLRDSAWQEVQVGEQICAREEKEWNCQHSVCPTLCNPMDCSLPISSVHRIFQTRILEWIAIPFPGNLPHPEREPRSPALQPDSLLSEPPGKCPINDLQLSSVTQSFPTLCDPMNRSTPGLLVHHQLPEFTQTHVH